jgi:flagellar hook-associated protein 2
MAVSSSSSSTAKSGSTLDVAGIVSQLMQAESKPLNKIEEKISVSTTKISLLGMFKAQLSTFQTALNDLQTPSNFSAWAAKLNPPSYASADLTTSAVAGSYQLDISRLARPSIWNVSGFTSEADALTWYNAAGQSSIKSAASATVFESALGQYVLSLKANATGTVAGFSVSGASLTGVTATEYQTAQDAQFNLNGVSFTRASNSVSDALVGVTLNLSAATVSPVTLSISQAESTAKAKLENLAKSYNDLLTLYKQQTQASSDSSTRGILNSDFALSSLMRQLLTGLMKPLTGTAGSALTGATDLTALGLKLSDTGTLAVDDKLLNTSTTLQSKLAAGLKIGYDADQGTDLSTRITQMLTAGGVLQERISTEQKVQSDLNTRKTNLQDKLLAVEARYTAQYSALDALLFKLNSTSDSLKSALDGLTASQNNN